MGLVLAVRLFFLFFGFFCCLRLRLGSVRFGSVDPSREPAVRLDRSSAKYNHTVS